MDEQIHIVILSESEREPISTACERMGLSVEHTTIATDGDAVQDETALDRARCVVITGNVGNGSLTSLCEIVSRRRPSIPIVVYPDEGNETIASVAVKAGADDYVPSSAEPKTLAVCVQNQIHSEMSDNRHDSLSGIEHELLDRERKVTNLHRVASNLEEGDTVEELYEQAVEAAEGVLNFDVCLVFRAHNGGLDPVAISTDLQDDDSTDRRCIETGIAAKSYGSERTYRIDDIEALEEEIPTGGDFTSVLSVPIEDWGVFQTFSADRADFCRQDEKLAELLVTHLSDALNRLEFESKLKTERDRFYSLFENVPDAVVSARHADGLVVDRVNPAFEEIFGYESEEIVGESLDRYIVPQDRAAEAAQYNDRGARGEIVETEVKRRTADGLRDFMVRIVPVADDEACRTFALYTDITEQKQRQKRVEILNRVLRHDLRNGMNIINGCAEMLAETVEDGGSVQYAEAIQERATELIGLAEKTRAVERTLGRGDDATGPVDVISAVEDAIEHTESEFAAGEFTCSLPTEAHARADDMLRTAIKHVVENAIEHNDSTNPQVEINLEREGPDGDTFVLRVADNGPGIPEDERDLLQEEKEITQLRHASGLGLWLVNWVVTQSGGALSFNENEPRGTVVTLQFPEADFSPSAIQSDGTVTGD